MLQVLAPARPSGRPWPAIGPRSGPSNARGRAASRTPSSLSSTGRSRYDTSGLRRRCQAWSGPMLTEVEQESGVPTGADPRIGVSILTYNRIDEVSRTVKRMLALPEQPRIVVVDNGSTDGTPDLLRRRFPDVRCVEQPGNPGAAGRNAGVAALGTPYVALCDDDTWWEPGSLRRAADLLDQYPRLGLIAGRVVIGSTNRPDPICDMMRASPIRADVPLPGPA